MPDSFPDTEAALRTWLRAQTSLTDLVGHRVFFAVPDDADESDFPMVTLARVGGGDDSSEAELDDAILQLTVFGQRRGKVEAVAVANVLRSLLRLREPVAWDVSTTCLGAVVESVVYSQDPSDQRPQYSLTVNAVCAVAPG